MKYSDPKLRDLLAGEYVLGSLQGRARARFVRLIAADPALRDVVHAWQQRLTPLSDETAAVPPPTRVLAALDARLDDPILPAPTRWQRPGLWRGLAALAATVALVLGVSLAVLQLRPAAPIETPSYVAILQDDRHEPALVITGFSTRSWELHVESLRKLSANETRTLQVWAIERGSETARPLVVLNAGERTQTIMLDEPKWKLVKSAGSLVITRSADSIDSALYRGPCINLKGGTSL